jgi:hypothetical protein
MARRTCKHRTSALAEPTTKWGVWQTGRAIVQAFEMEN